MPYLVVRGGKLLLDDTGKLKVSESNPPAAECCCEEGGCLGVGDDEQDFSDGMPDHYLRNELDPGLFVAEVAVSGGRLQIQDAAVTSSFFQGIVGPCISIDIFSGEWSISLETKIYWDSESPHGSSGVTLREKDLTDAVLFTFGSNLSTNKYALGGNGFTTIIVDEVPQQGDVVKLVVRGTDLEVEEVEGWLNGTLVASEDTFSPTQEFDFETEDVLRASLIATGNDGSDIIFEFDYFNISIA